MIPEKGLQGQGKGEGARYPSPTVARAAPPHAGKGSTSTANDNKAP